MREWARLFNVANAAISLTPPWLHLFVSVPKIGAGLSFGIAFHRVWVSLSQVNDLSVLATKNGGRTKQPMTHPMQVHMVC